MYKHTRTNGDESTPLLQSVDPDSEHFPAEGETCTDAPDPLAIRTRKNPTPLPIRQLAVIMLMRGMIPLAFEIIFPFINEMIFELGIVDNPEDVGFYSGLVESIFSCMSLITVMPISYLADIIGRKPIILWGTLATGVSTASFGMSKTLSAMIISRCIGGAAGSVWVATKTVIAECTDQTNQGKAFQYLTIAYRSGQILGLPLGGLLSHPERTGFTLFQSEFWIENPFALPCFVAAGFAVISVFIAYLLLDETLKTRRKKISRESPVLDSSSETDINNNDGDHRTNNQTSLRQILTPPVIQLLVSNTIMCFVSEVVFSIFPLFSFTPVSSGGLGQTSSSIGLQMSARAIIHVGMMFMYSQFEYHFKTPTRFYKAIMCGWPAVVCCLPGLNVLARGFGPRSVAVDLAMLGFFVIWGFSGFAWTGMTILVTDASPSEEALSKINGLSQMSIILPQAIAPATGTALFAFSIQNSDIMGGHLIWAILLIITCGGAVHSLMLQEPTNTWRSRGLGR